MTQITFQNGQILMRDGKVGTEQGCCCGQPCTCSQCYSWDMTLNGVCVAQGINDEVLDGVFDYELPGCSAFDPFTGHCFGVGRSAGGGLPPYCWPVGGYGYDDGVSSYDGNTCGPGYCVDDLQFPYTHTTAGGAAGMAWIKVKDFGECDAGGQMLYEGMENYECTSEGETKTGSPEVTCAIFACPCYCCDGTTIKIRLYFYNMFRYVYPWQSDQFCFNITYAIGNVFYRDYQGPFPACETGDVQVPPVSDFTDVEFEDICGAESGLAQFAATMAENPLYGFGVRGDCECDIGPLTMRCMPLPACLVQEFP
jgi:hypothetical protein